MKRLCVVCAALACACTSSIAQYPRGWPAFPEPPPGCDGVAGTYADKGESGGTSVPASLSDELFNRRPMLKANTVTLAFVSGGALKVTVSGDDGELLTHVFTTQAKTFECTAAAVVLHPDAKWQGMGASDGMPLVFHNTVSYELRANAKELVVKQEIRSTMFILLVPTKDRTVRWSRFERVWLTALRLAESQRPSQHR